MITTPNTQKLQKQTKNKLKPLNTRHQRMCTTVQTSMTGLGIDQKSQMKPLDSLRGIENATEVLLGNQTIHRSGKFQQTEENFKLLEDKNNY